MPTIEEYELRIEKLKDYAIMKQKIYADYVGDPNAEIVRAEAITANECYALAANITLRKALQITIGAAQMELDADAERKKANDKANQHD